MTPDDPRVRQFLTRSMTMRVATLSASGVPHLTPLRFIHDGRAIYALTRGTSPAVRHIRQQPGVVLLLDAERPTGPVLRLRAHAAVRGEPQLRGWWERRAATKYFLRPGGLWNMLRHWRNLPTWARTRRSAMPADTVLIEFVPEAAEFVPRPSAGEVGRVQGGCA